MVQVCALESAMLVCKTFVAVSSFGLCVMCLYLRSLASLLIG